MDCLSSPLPCHPVRLGIQGFGLAVRLAVGALCAPMCEAVSLPYPLPLLRCGRVGPLRASGGVSGGCFQPSRCVRVASLSSDARCASLPPPPRSRVRGVRWGWFRVTVGSRGIARSTSTVFRGPFLLPRLACAWFGCWFRLRDVLRCARCLRSTRLSGCVALFPKGASLAAPDCERVGGASRPAPAPVPPGRPRSRFGYRCQRVYQTSQSIANPPCSRPVCAPLALGLRLRSPAPSRARVRGARAPAPCAAPALARVARVRSCV